MSRGVTLRTGAIGGVLRTGQGPLVGCWRTGQSALAGCYEQDRDQWRGVGEQDRVHWRGVTNRTGTIGRVLRTGKMWRGFTHRTGTIGGVLRTGQSPMVGCYEQDSELNGFHKRPGVSVLILRSVF